MHTLGPSNSKLSASLLSFNSRFCEVCRCLPASPKGSLALKRDVRISTSLLSRPLPTSFLWNGAILIYCLSNELAYAGLTMEYQTPDFTLTSKIKHGIGAVLLLAASAFYVYGTCAPAIRVSGRGPGFLDNSEHAQDFSMIVLVRLLLRQRSYIPFACTVVFSFVIPVVKFTLISCTLVVTTCCRRRNYSVWLPVKTLRVLVVICKYQLVDVFSVILLVTFVNFVGISVEPLLASQAYLCYCLLSLICTQWLCHCYEETFELGKQKYAREFDVSLSSPLLSKNSPFYSASVDKSSSGGFTLSYDNSDGCIAPQPRNMESSSSSTTVAGSGEEEHQYNGALVHRHDVRQRVTRNIRSAWPLPTSVSIPAGPSERTCQRSDHGSEADPEQVCSRSSDLRRVRTGHLRVIWVRASSHRIKLARPFVFIILLVSSACRSGLVFCCRLGSYLNRLLRSSSAGACQNRFNAPKRLSGDNLWGDSFSRQRLSEYLIRMFFLTLLLCISAFAFAVCWIRPILEVSLVPGQQRGFAIETSSRSLGDIFWRLYSMGHVLSGCGILFVFPLLATFVVYVSSIGAVVGACFLAWSASSAVEGGSSSMLLNGGSLVGSGALSGNRRRVIHATKFFSYVSSFAGDIAMPDVQSIGLLTSYFIVNNVDFFGARLPSVPHEEPSGIMDRLLWKFSGFWAMLAFGVSGSLVHRLSISFEGVSREVQKFKDSEEPPRYPPNILMEGTGVLERRLHSVHGEESPFSIRDCYGALHVEDSSTSSLSQRVLSCDFSSRTSSYVMLSPHDLNGRRNPSLFGICLSGGIRVVVALALLLPIWQKPVEVMDIDLTAVNNQLRLFVEYVNPSLKKVLPQSLGDCASLDHPAPPPCTGAQPLANIRTSAYEALARWVTGLKTTQLSSIRFDAAPNSRIVLQVAGKIKNTSLSLRIGQCLYGDAPGTCPVVWDGTDGCCADNTTFTIQVEVECDSVFPYLRRATPLQTQFSRLVITEKILGIFPVEVADITEIVEDHVSEWVKTFIDPQNRWIHWTDQANMSLIEFLNRLLSINAPVGIRCPRSG